MREEPRIGFKGKDNSLSRVSVSLRKAFGVDGERAVEVARLITLLGESRPRKRIITSTPVREKVKNGCQGNIVPNRAVLGWLLQSYWRGLCLGLGETG